MLLAYSSPVSSPGPYNSELSSPDPDNSSTPYKTSPVPGIELSENNSSVETANISNTSGIDLSMCCLTSLDASTCAESYIDSCPLDFGSVCSPEDWGSDALEENHETEFDDEGAAVELDGINLQAVSSILVIKPYHFPPPPVLGIICNIFVRIRILGSIPLTNES
jgi:hypothetical protein